jgi:hypothetical protein
MTLPVLTTFKNNSSTTRRLLIAVFVVLFTRISNFLSRYDSHYTYKLVGLPFLFG